MTEEQIKEALLVPGTRFISPYSNRTFITTEESVMDGESISRCICVNGSADWPYWKYQGNLATILHSCPKGEQHYLIYN